MSRIAGHKFIFATLVWRRLDRYVASALTVQFLLYVSFAIILLSGVPVSAQSGKPITLVTYGDSLSAGYNLAEKDSFPAQLEAALKARGHAVRIVNASVSGDTSAAGLARFDWSFPQEAKGAILELGANDALRGHDPEIMRKNLDKIISKMKQRDVHVLLAGMLAPRNMDVTYTAAFDRVFPELAKKHDLLFYPFFLFDVVGKRELNLDDGLHPNAKGVEKIVAQILPKVEALLKRIAGKDRVTQ